MEVLPPIVFHGYHLRRLPLDQARMGPTLYDVCRPDGSRCCSDVSRAEAEETVVADMQAQFAAPALHIEPQDEGYAPLA
jgi:hypothetical protein